MNGLKIELSKFQFIEQFIPQNYEFFRRTQKSAPDNRFWLPRASLLQVFVAGENAAFEVDFDAIISDDDLFHQLLHDHAVICVYDCAALFSGSMTSPALSLTAVMISSASSIMSLIAAV